LDMIGGENQLKSDEENLKTVVRELEYDRKFTLSQISNQRR